MRNEPGTEIDDLIDRMATSLTAAPHGDGLRRAVRARLDDAPARTRPAVLWYSGAAVAAVVFALVVVLWPAPPQIRVAPADERLAGVVATQPDRPPGSSGIRDEASRAPVAPPPVRPPERTEAVLPGTLPLELPQIELEPLEIEELGVPTLVVEGLTVEPLPLQQ